MTSVFTREWGAGTQRGRHVKTEAENGAMHLHLKGGAGFPAAPPEAMGGAGSLRASRRSRPCQRLNFRLPASRV